MWAATNRFAATVVGEGLAAGFAAGAGIMAAQPPAFLDAPPIAMRLFLDLARAEYGSMAEYLVSVGMTREAIHTLRSALLAK